MKILMVILSLVLLSACGTKEKIVDDVERKAQQIEYEEQKAKSAKQRLDRATQ